MKNLNKLLNELDLTDLEFKIYTTLIKQGTSSVLEVSKSTAIPRTTVHQNIEKLLKKGFVSQIVTNKRRRLVAEDPDVIKQNLKSKIIEVEAKRKELGALSQLLPEIIATLRPPGSKIKSKGIEIKYYNDIEQIRNLYSEVVRAKEVRSYVNFTELVSQFPENVEKFAKALNSGTEVWDITIGPEDDSDNTVNKLKNFRNYHHSFIPNSDKGVYLDYLIYNGNISVIIDEGKISAVTIKSQALYENSKFIYDLFWQGIS